MTLYECRNCSALFTNPKGPSCPACDKTGPTCVDVNGDNSYQNNWYRPITHPEDLLQ